MRRRLMLKSRAGVSPVLPAEYQRVEYIESHGQEYIVINSQPNADETYKIKFSISELTNYNMGIFGGGYSSDKRTFQCYVTSSGVMSARWAEDTLTADVTLNEIINVELSASIIKINNNQLIDPRGNIIDRRSIVLFARNQDGYAQGVQNLAYMKIFEYSESNNMKLYPCYRKSDGVIGLYDIVSQTFYTNAGTGTFTKGADV